MACGTGKIKRAPEAILGAILWLAALALCAPAARLYAQDEEGAAKGPQQQQIYHEPPDGAELPPPGRGLALPVQLMATRDISMQMSALVTLDGKLMQVPLKNQFLNHYDRPEFLLSVPAPQAELAYQFILYLPDGGTLVSERYVVRRPCRPNISVPDAAALDALQGDERLNAMVAAQRNLKSEVDAYEHAMSMLKEIDDLTKE